MREATKQAIRQVLARGGFRLTPLQELRFEIQLALLRLGNRILPARVERARRLRTLRGYDLHVGCGPRILEGWVNVDARPGPGADHALDLRWPLPFADGSARRIFSEHVLEHFGRDHLRGILREFHRILEPGGVVRTVVPDLAIYCERYVAGDLDALRAVHPDTGIPADAVNEIFLDHFHRYVHDFASLRRELEDAGFVEIRRTPYGESEHPGLARDLDEAARSAGSLCVEATRPTE